MDSSSILQSDIYLEALSIYQNAYKLSNEKEECFKLIEIGINKFKEALRNKMSYEEWICSKIYLFNLLLGGPYIYDSFSEITKHGLEYKSTFIEAVNSFEDALMHDINSGFIFFGNIENRALHLFFPDLIYIKHALFLKNELNKQYGEKYARKTASDYLLKKRKSLSAFCKVYRNSKPTTPFILPYVNRYFAIYSTGWNEWISIVDTIRECSDRLSILKNNTDLYDDYFTLLNDAKKYMQRKKNNKYL